MLPVTGFTRITTNYLATENIVVKTFYRDYNLVINRDCYRIIAKQNITIEKFFACYNIN